MTEQQKVSVPDPRPSLLVACIGTAFMPGVQEAAVKCAEVYSEMMGPCHVAGQPNITVLPPLGLGAMHNFLIMKACESKFDFLLFLHNDVLMGDPGTLVKLVQRGKPMITPFFDQAGIPGVDVNGPHKIAEPMFSKDQGVLQIKWTIPACLLFNTMVFAVAGERPYSSALIYSEDEYDCLWFTRHGITIWQDTDLKVKLLRGPGLLADTLKERKVLRPGEPP